MSDQWREKFLAKYEQFAGDLPEDPRSGEPMLPLAADTKHMLRLLRIEPIKTWVEKSKGDPKDGEVDLKDVRREFRMVANKKGYDPWKSLYHYFGRYYEEGKEEEARRLLGLKLEEEDPLTVAQILDTWGQIYGKKIN